MSIWIVRAGTQWWLRVLLLSLLVTCTIQLLGCGANRDSAVSGQLQLEYLKASDKTVSLKLTNGTNRTIAVRGSWTLSFAIRTWPGDSQVECESKETGKSDAEPLMFAHGKSRYFDVSQGESVTLVVPSELPNRYRGGNCKLRLILRDGTFVGPIQFSP